MPRTSAVDCPGCPPLRALTTDTLGLVKVVEARGKAGTPKVVETWGPPDASRGVVAVSYADRATNPVLAVARRNGSIEFLNPLNGNALAATKVGESDFSNYVHEDDPIVGLHLFKIKQNVLSSRPSFFLMCTEKGRACLRSIALSDASQDAAHTNSPSTWDVCAAGKVMCSSVDGNEHHALFGGKGIELNVWDLEKCNKIWTAKPPPSNSLGIFSPTWFTAATFLSKEDHRKIAAGTNNHQVRLYDISAQRRPVISVDFRESPIKVVAEDLDGYTIYAGTASGDLASFDMRTGKLLGCFIGKCCGSIRSIVRHPEMPVLASCGLDSYLRLWDVRTRQLLSAVFLKQHLTNVVIDSHFSDEGTSADQPGDSLVINSEAEDDEKLLHEKSREKSKEKNQHKNKKKKSKNDIRDDDQMDSSEDSFSTIEGENNARLPASKRRKPSDQKEHSRKPHKKRSKKSICLTESDD